MISRLVEGLVYQVSRNLRDIFNPLEDHVQCFLDSLSNREQNPVQLSNFSKAIFTHNIELFRITFKPSFNEFQHHWFLVHKDKNDCVVFILSDGYDVSKKSLKITKKNPIIRKDSRIRFEEKSIKQYYTNLYKIDSNISVFFDQIEYGSHNTINPSKFLAERAIN